MTALNLLRDGISTATELAALLFVAPIATATAAESRAVAAATVIESAEARAPVAPASLRPLHLIESAVEMRLLGLLADLRVVQTVHNVGAQPVDLGARLRAAGDGIDSIAVSRDGYAIELLTGGDCGGEDEPQAGHARTEVDERVAELTRLPPGQHATIAITATETLRPAGPAWRVALPATVTPIRAQALLLSEPQGHYVIVVPPSDADGSVTVTLRPAGAPSQRLQFGAVAAGNAYVIPVGSAQALAGLKAGAIELEVRGAREVQWTTLPIVPRGPGVATLVRLAD